MSMALLRRLWQWLGRGEHVHRLWLGPYCVAVAWVGLAAAIITPPHGSGLPLCWLHATTGIPCPGCGLTRSLSCAIRGLFLESWQYHPMGMLILGLFAFTAFQSLLPRRMRQAIASGMQSRVVLCNGVYVAFVAAFVLFGTVRAIMEGPVAYLTRF